MSSRPGGTGGPRLRRLNMGQVFIILAVVSAVLTIIIFKSLISKPPEKVEIETRPIVVAAHHLFAGEILKPESLRVVDWPADYYPETDVYEETGKLVGRALQKDIYSGEPVFRLSLAGEDSQGGMPVVIPPGHRAMTILVTENKGVGGFVKPGDRVDVIGTFRFVIPEETQKAIAKRSGILYQDSFEVSQTVLQNVLVLATAQQMYEKKNALEAGLQGAEANNPQAGQQAAGGANTLPTDDPTTGKVVSSVTLAVTPEQAEKLAFTETRSELRLALRPENEHEKETLLGASADDIMPIKQLFDKAMKMISDLDPALLGQDEEDELMPPPPPPPPPVAELPPPPPMMEELPPPEPAHTVQVIEGTTTSSVSF